MCLIDITQKLDFENGQQWQHFERHNFSTITKNKKANTTPSIIKNYKNDIFFSDNVGLYLAGLPCINNSTKLM